MYEFIINSSKMFRFKLSILLLLWNEIFLYNFHFTASIYKIYIQNIFAINTRHEFG